MPHYDGMNPSKMKRMPKSKMGKTSFGKKNGSATSKIQPLHPGGRGSPMGGHMPTNPAK